MRSFLLSIVSILFISYQADAQKVKFKFEDFNNDTVYLAKHYGSKLYYADTAYAKAGVFTFDGSKHKEGLYVLVSNKTRVMDFIIDENDIDITVGSSKDVAHTVKINKSKSNKVFYSYVTFMTDTKKESAKLNEAYEKTAEGSEEREKLVKEFEAINQRVLDFQTKIIEENKGSFVALMILLSMDVQIPEKPADNTDTLYAYHYYIEHFWDGVDFKDDRLVRTPVFQTKMEKYYSTKGLVQIPDTITKYASWMINQMDWEDQENEVFKFTVHFITSHYEQSKIMGMDRVFCFMAENYYCGDNNYAYWMPEENSKKLCERAAKACRTSIGNYAPPIILTDSTEQNWINLYQVEAKYTILYFWDPNCGHCKKSTPKLQMLYEKKFKDYGVEIFAVGKATGDDFEDWKEFIVKNNLQFINVGLTKNIYNQAIEDPRPLLKYTTIESLNYSDTYDIYSTPRVFVLDEKKKIIAKQLSVHQLEKMMDHLTGHEDAELLTEPDPENEEEFDH